MTGKRFCAGNAGPASRRQGKQLNEQKKKKNRRICQEVGGGKSSHWRSTTINAKSFGTKKTVEEFHPVQEGRGKEGRRKEKGGQKLGWRNRTGLGEKGKAQNCKRKRDLNEEE